MTMMDDANNEDKIPIIENATDGERRHSFPGRLWRLSLAPCIPARYSLAVLSFFGMLIMYALRVSLSVAIVEMVNSTAVSHRGYNAPAFHWSHEITGQVLAAFYYGYLITQIPGGWLAERIGGKWVFGVGIAMTSILTLFIPIVATISVWLLIIVRALGGFFEGVTLPAMHSMWGQWAPPPERSILTTITFAGIYAGMFISFSLSAILATYGFDGGWPSAFYVWGTIGIIWFLVWSVLAFNSPANHPRISDKERDYIESSITVKRTAVDKNHPTPWLAILTSPAVWGIVVVHTTHNWGFYMLLTLMPTYYRQALPNIHVGKGIVMTGVFSMVPYLFLTIMTLVSGPIADLLRARWFSTTLVRKMFTTFAFLSSAIFLLLCGYFGSTTASTVILLTVAVGIKGVAAPGFWVNHLDISPRYAGVLMGLSNFFATLSGIISPPIGKEIAKEPLAPKGTDAYLNTYREEWRDVFIVTAEVYIFGALVYLILGSGELQWWADGIPRNKNKKRSSSEGKSEPCIRETDLDAEQHIINADSSDSNKSATY